MTYYEGFNVTLVCGGICYIGGKENSPDSKSTWSLTLKDPRLCTTLNIGGNNADLLIDDIVMVRQYLQIKCGMLNKENWLS